MNSILREPLASPQAWRGEDMRGSDGWVHELTGDEVGDLDRAVARAKRGGRSLRELGRADFDLPALAAASESWLTELDDGRGFVLVRGVPVERYSLEQAQLAYWVLGLQLGTAVSQNAAGDVLGHVRDEGLGKRDPSVRLYRTRERLGFHTDGSDIVGLLCWKPSRSGGQSRIASSVAIHNEILRRRPDLIDTLYEPFPFDRNDEQAPGEPPYWSLPLCAFDAGRLRTFYIGWYIRDSQRHAEAPRLTRAQSEVIDLLDEIASDPRFYLDMDFRPGDVQWLKNSVILHARTDFEDFAEPERKRHLLRLWLTSRRAFADGDDLLRGGIPKKDGVRSDSERIGASR
jgi:Taurine catabolism dioxygenase TauD, TfdA family